MNRVVRISISIILVIASSFLETCEELATGGEPVCVSVPCKPQKTPQPAPPRSEMDKLYDEGLRFSYGGDLPDENESVEALRIYGKESRKVDQVIKKRAFSEPLDTGKLTLKEWLTRSVNALLAARAKGPESRHLSEMLGWVYREIYYDTRDTAHLRKAADAFIRAEDLGMKYPGPYYFTTVTTTAPYRIS